MLSSVYQESADNPRYALIDPKITVAGNIRRMDF